MNTLPRSLLCSPCTPSSRQAFMVVGLGLRLSNNVGASLTQANTAHLRSDMRCGWGQGASERSYAPVDTCRLLLSFLLCREGFSASRTHVCW